MAATAATRVVESIDASNAIGAVSGVCVHSAGSSHDEILKGVDASFQDLVFFLELFGALLQVCDVLGCF